MGEQGPQGVTGPQGPQGERGCPGPMGEQDVYKRQLLYEAVRASIKGVGLC